MNLMGTRMAQALLALLLLGVATPRTEKLIKWYVWAVDTDTGVAPATARHASACKQSQSNARTKVSESAYSGKPLAPKGGDRMSILIRQSGRREGGEARSRGQATKLERRFLTQSDLWGAAQDLDRRSDSRELSRARPKAVAWILFWHTLATNEERSRVWCAIFICRSGSPGSCGSPFLQLSKLWNAMKYVPSYDYPLYGVPLFFDLT